MELFSITIIRLHEVTTDVFYHIVKRVQLLFENTPYKRTNKNKTRVHHRKEKNKTSFRISRLELL